MEGWRTTTLGDLFAIGSSKRVLQSQWQSSGVPFYRGREITALGELGHVDNELFISEALYSEYSSKYGVPAPGDIMLTAIGTIGNSYVVQPGDRFYFKDASVLWMASKDAIDSAFVNHWLKSDAFRDQLDVGNGATVDTLTIQKLKSIKLSCPADRSLQRRIVAILDDAFEAIATAKANTEKNLQNAREVFVNYLKSVFSTGGADWTVTRVGAVAECCLGKMLDKAKNKGDLKPYLRNLNVRWFAFDLTDLQEMRFTDDEYERYSVRQGDVVVCEGGYPGRAAVWEDEQPIFIQKALHRVRFSNAIQGRWFLYYLYSLEASGDLSHHFTGTGIQHLTGAALSRLSMPLAPVSITGPIVERFSRLSDSVTSLEAVQRNKLTALDELKKSLLHQAFTGQLTAKQTDHQLEAVA